MRTWFYEIYTKNPQTLEEGWDIAVGFVLRAEDYDAAKRKLEIHFGRLFDCVIQLYESSLHPLGRGCKPKLIR